MQQFTIDSITLAAMIRICTIETLTEAQRLELIKAHLLNIKTPTLMNGTNFKMKKRLRIRKIRRSRLRFNYKLLQGNK